MSEIKTDIIGVPLDLGVAELGLKIGPEALREAGLIDAMASLGMDVRDLGDLPLPQSGNSPLPARNRPDLIAAYCAEVRDAVSAALRAGRTPVCLGGDHSLAIGSLAGVAAEAKRPGCLWLDAHPDANTPETSPSGNIHGMPVAIALGHGPAELAEVAGGRAAVAYENMVLLGTRDIDPGEMHFLQAHGVRMFTVFDILEQGLPRVAERAIEAITADTDAVHVSMDLDVLHGDIAPGVGLPSSCGLDMREAAYLCQRLAGECRITSIDIVGLNPVRDEKMKTARCAIELLLSLLGHSFSFSYNGYMQGQRR